MVSSQTSSERSQSTIRTACKKDRARISPQERQQASEEIAKKIVSSELFSTAANIAIYIPMKSEVDTWTLIERAWQLKKRIFAPITQKTSTLQFRQFDADSKFSTDNLGLSEPVAGDFIAAEKLDLVFTPVVAFDSQNNRIGMGGGYYDRTFSFLKKNSDIDKPVLVGIAFERQRVEKIAPNPWDIRLFSIFTEFDGT